MRCTLTSLVPSWLGIYLAFLTCAKFALLAQCVARHLPKSADYVGMSKVLGTTSSLLPRLDVVQSNLG